MLSLYIVHLLYIYMMLRFVGALINTHDDDACSLLPATSQGYGNENSTTVLCTGRIRRKQVDGLKTLEQYRLANEG